MKQLKTMAAMAVAALTMLVSCSKDDNNNTVVPNGEDASVKIQFTYGQSTKADGGAIADGTALSISAGHILFVTPTGLISSHVGIANSAGSAQVTLSDLTSGEAVVQSVSSDVTKCYILANDSFAITGDMAGQNITADILDKVIAVNALNNATGTVANVPLFGVGNVATGSGTTAGGLSYDASVQVTINALASRIQIGGISSKDYVYADNSATVTIDSFTVEGIYINNFYPSMTVGSTAGTLVNNGQVVANYSTTTAGTSYAAGGVGEKLADYLNKTAMLGSVNPTNAVWAYNVFPGSDVPHIVIKLSEVKYTNSATTVQTTLSDQFITVQEFKYATGHPQAGTVVASFAANNIYTFSDIKFDYTNLASTPEATKLDVLVTVTMMSWIDNAVEASF